MTSTPPTTEHDLIAVGCGPFNLGLAALASTVDGLDLAVLESRAELRWHPGLMFDDAMLQVSFLADLVTLIEPAHPLSFLCYLKDADRMYPFYIRERFHPTRREYEDYLRWCAGRLPAVRFGHEVTSVEWLPGERRFAVDADVAGRAVRLLAADLVLGIGTEPAVPAALAGLPPERLVHSGAYLHRSADVDAARSVTVVGSGQSGAEVVADLLRRNDGPDVAWVTRTESFAPLDYSKLVLEMTAPDYMRYFHGLPEETRDRLLAGQWRHYKGISTETIDEIHDLLYRRDVAGAAGDARLCHATAVEDAVMDGDDVVLTLRNGDTGRVAEHRTGLVVAATGYRHRDPEFLAPLKDAIERDERGRMVIGEEHDVRLRPEVGGRIFVANADLHSHGAAAPDLGIGAYRNAVILNAVCGREVYRLPRRTGYGTMG